MYNLRKNRKGQSTVEYVMVVTAILAIVFVVKDQLGIRYQNAALTASSQVEPTATALSQALAPAN